MWSSDRDLVATEPTLARLQLLRRRMDPIRKRHEVPQDSFRCREISSSAPRRRHRARGKHPRRERRRRSSPTQPCPPPSTSCSEPTMKQPLSRAMCTSSNVSPFHSNGAASTRRHAATVRVVGVGRPQPRPEDAEVSSIVVRVYCPARPPRFSAAAPATVTMSSGRDSTRDVAASISASAASFATAIARVASSAARIASSPRVSSLQSC